MSRFPWTLASDVPDNSRATLICTPEIEFSRPFLLVAYHLVASFSSLFFVKAISAQEQKRRCGEICNMGLRTLGDIDGYDRSAKGNAWLLLPSTTPPSPFNHPWYRQRVASCNCVYSQQWLTSHAAQWVFFSFGAIIKSYSCGLTLTRDRGRVCHNEGCLSDDRVIHYCLCHFRWRVPQECQINLTPVLISRPSHSWNIQGISGPIICFFHTAYCLP